MKYKPNLSDFHKSKNTEELLNQEYHDTKKKTNRSDKTISVQTLQLIENGITSEQLDGFNLPVFKYGTQITIHGIFPDLEESLRIGGYKRVFQNQNKSLGVKYQAIDYDKKRRIYRAFSHVHNFEIQNNSKEYCAYKFIEVKDKDDAVVKVQEYQPLFDSITLKFGQKKMFFTAINYWGLIKYYLVLQIYINAIHEADIAPFFLKTFGKTEQQIDSEIKEKEAADKVEWKKKMAEWKEENRIKEEKLKQFVDTELERLSTVGYNYQNDIPVTEGLTLFDVEAFVPYDKTEPELRYVIKKICLPQRAKIFCITETYCKTLEDILVQKESINESRFGTKYRKPLISGIILQ